MFGSLPRRWLTGKHRDLTLTRLAWGGVLVAAPSWYIRVGGGSPDRRSRRIVRILGFRHLAQSLLELGRGEDAERLGAVVDGLHALTDLGFAALDRRWRRAALLDGCIAAAFSGLQWRRQGVKADVDA